MTTRVRKVDVMKLLIRPPDLPVFRILLTLFSFETRCIF